MRTVPFISKHSHTDSIQALIVPFFLYLTFSNPIDDDGNLGLTLSMIATVVANVTGLMTGGLHLFLRSNTIGTIGPKNKLADVANDGQCCLAIVREGSRLGVLAVL